MEEAPESLHRYYSSDEESAFSRKHSSSYPIIDPSSPTPWFSTPQTCSSGLREPSRSPDRHAARRRSSLSSKGFLTRRDDADLMVMEVQVHTSTTFDNVSDDEESDSGTWGLLDHNPDDPELWRRDSIVVAATKRRRSSLSVASKRPRLQPTDYLQEEYLRTKLRFIESTMRTEQTRIIIQRQRSLLLQTTSYNQPIMSYHRSQRQGSNEMNDENRRRLISSLGGGSMISEI